MPETVGPHYAGTGTEIPGPGIGWTRPAGAIVPDDDLETAVVILDDYDSRKLYLRNFDFHLDEGKLVCGIKVQIRAKSYLAENVNWRAQLTDESGLAIGDVKEAALASGEFAWLPLSSLSDTWGVAPTTGVGIGFGVLVWVDHGSGVITLDGIRMTLALGPFRRPGPIHSHRMRRWQRVRGQ